MLSDARGVKNVPFEQFDMQVKSLLAPIVLAEGTNTGAAVQLPGAGRFCFTQVTGAIAGGGSIVGHIEESANGSTGWATVTTFAAAGAASTQKLYATTTKPYVRHVGVVTGGGSGTVATHAGVAY